MSPIELELVTTPKSSNAPGDGLELYTGPTESQTIEYWTITMAGSLVVKKIVSFHCGVVGDEGVVHLMVMFELAPGTIAKGNPESEIHDPFNRAFDATVRVVVLLPLLVITT